MTIVRKIKDKKVNFEFNKEYIKVVTDKISSNDAEFITNSFKEIHPADAADIIEHLNQDDREKLIKLNNFKINPEVFVELNESIQSEIIKYLSKEFNQNLYGKNQCKFLIKEKIFNGKVERVLHNGNLVAQIENIGSKEFKSSEIKIIY